MGYTKVHGSDLSSAMVDATRKSTAEFIAKQNHPVEYSVSTVDAAKITEDFPDTVSIKNTAIVTEGYLGEVLNARTITLDRIKEQRRKLARIYDGFFSGLRTVGFRGTIIISFPFWELQGKYVFFEEILSILHQAGWDRESLLPKGSPYQETVRGSLLYKRPGQTVGREIFKLRLR